MKTIVRYIGVTDKNDCIHAVPLTSGVNIITGRSSTGKSALIEIFDYCFGSSEFTVPEGVITECAEIYFVVMQVGETLLVLARRKADTHTAFIKEERDLSVIEKKDHFAAVYFRDEYFVGLGEFKKTLRRYFGSNIQITDIDESQEARLYRGNRKKPTPSIRSFTSFMLQHQNLVANKHAIFYRFDEKEKRDQAIEHFKVFAGFADQEYFLKKQELERLHDEKRKIELQIPRQSEVKELKKSQIASAQKEYIAISGRAIDLGDLDAAISSPQITLDAIKEHKVDVVAISDEQAKLRAETDRELAKLTADYRKQQNLVKDIESSIEYAENCSHIADSTITPENAELHASVCPFCSHDNDTIEQQANGLSSAITWLNDELRKSQYSQDSFREDLKKAEEQLDTIGKAIQVKKEEIRELDAQIEDLERYRTQHELALKVQLKIESYFEDLLGKPYQTFEQRLSEIKTKITNISKDLKEKYNIEGKLRAAERELSEYMAEITSSLDFEESYKPISLKFSLDTFDLWNEKEGRKVYLRSMGSGANWLSCHIALFLALNRYFCELGDECAIPTSLFFDQPSQVYFPSVLDSGEEFSAEAIAEKAGGSRQRPVDADITAVTSLYSEFVRYCHDTLQSTGIEPQIIVTDHADRLNLSGDNDFETFVKARWRSKDEGFIKLDESHDAIGESE